MSGQIKANSQSAAALMTLRDMILSGELTAGERLLEVPLAKRLGLSRTPLRAALAALSDEGLLERKATTGYVVRKFSFTDVVDAIELRGVLEGTAARIAAERGVSTAALKRMHDLLDRLDRVLEHGPSDMDLDAYQEANGEFHQELAGLAGSDVIRREIERVVQLPFASPVAFLIGQGDVEVFRLSLGHAHAQHHTIIEAIERREGARAEAITREHARVARSNLEYVMQHDRSLISQIPGLDLVSA